MRPSLALALLLFLAGRAAAGDLDTGNIPSPQILEPEGQASATVFLLSDREGWRSDEEEAAAVLRQSGAIVIGIDLPAYLARLESENRDCAYTVSSIESLNRQVQRRAGLSHYHLPVIAGIGAGGAMALAIAAQTPASTVGDTVAIDPDPEIALRKPLCTPAEKRKTDTGMVYGLKPGTLPNGISVLLSPTASEAGRAHVEALRREHSEIALDEIEEASPARLAEAVLGRSTARASALEALPLTLVETRAKQALLSIIISGDGGWRDIDKKVAAYLAEDGIPTVGVDALRYFWSERSPTETAQDLERIIDAYAPRYGAEKILLIGYSFGANVLPAAYLEMRADYRDRVVLLSLLAPSRKADFEIAVSGWLGVEGEGKAGFVADSVRAGDPAKVQCIYGLQEKESACHDLLKTPAKVLALPGGHHFDGDYRALTNHIVAAALRHLKGAPEALAD